VLPNAAWIWRSDLYIVKMTSSLPGGPTAQLQQLITNSCLTVPDVLTVIPLINQRQQQQHQPLIYLDKQTGTCNSLCRCHCRTPLTYRQEVGLLNSQEQTSS